MTGDTEGMGHLALQRVWHSPQSAGESLYQQNFYFDGYF